MNEKPIMRMCKKCKFIGFESEFYKKYCNGCIENKMKKLAYNALKKEHYVKRKKR